MKISELQPKQGKVDVTGELIQIEEPRAFNKFGKEGKVANAILKDDSGQVKLTLWNEQAEMVKQGNKVAIKNGYVGEWQGEMQLSTGKFGTLEVLPAASDIESRKEEPASVKEEEFEE